MPSGNAAPPAIDVAQIFADFERVLGAEQQANQWNEDKVAERRDKLFFQWLEGNARISNAEYRAALIEYDRRKVATLAAKEAAKARDQVLGGLSFREREQFDAEYHPEDCGSLDELRDRLAAFRAKQQAAEAAQRERETAAFQQAEQARQVAAEQARQAAEARAREEQARRDAAEAALTAHLADPTWVRGETAEALRAVAAWRRWTQGWIAFTLPPGAAHEALAAADAALTDDITARRAAIDVAEATNEDLKRLARGEPPVAVPEHIVLEDLIDADAIARWLVAHVDPATLKVGRWQQVRDEPPQHVLQPPRHEWWQDIHRQAARWATYAEIVAEAAGDTALLTLARRAITTARFEPRFGGDAPLDALEERLENALPCWDGWYERPAPKAAKPEHNGKRRRQQERQVIRRGTAIQRYVAKNAGCSGNDIVEHVPGSKADVLADVKAMVEAGELTYDGKG